MRYNALPCAVLLLVAALPGCSNADDQVQPVQESPSADVKPDERLTGDKYTDAAKKELCESIRDSSRSVMGDNTIELDYKDPYKIGAHCSLESSFEVDSTPVQRLDVGVKLYEYDEHAIEGYVDAATRASSRDDTSMDDVNSECFIYSEVGSKKDTDLPGIHGNFSYKELKSGKEAYCGSKRPVKVARATFVRHGTQVVVDIVLGDAGEEEDDLPFDPKRVGDLREAMMEDMLTIAS